MLYLQPRAVLGRDGERPGHAILVEDDRIAEIAPASAVTPPADVEVLSFPDALAVPGFLDIQFNGAFGSDFTSDPETIWKVAERLPEHGVTAFLPTIISSHPDQVERAMAVLADPPGDFAGATPLGLHIEGPFLEPIRRGAHDPDCLRAPDLELARRWSRERGVRLVTLAPEREGADALVSHFLSDGVIVFAGHSDANLEQAQAAFDLGVAGVTHLFNAMPALNHRQPGLPGAALADPRVYTSMIVDGVHVHPLVVALVQKIVGDRMIMVTDAMAAMGCPPGRYPLGEQQVVVNETSARLEDGTLAGSILRLDQAVRNHIQFTGGSLEAALATVTTNPARLLGENRGRLQQGALADVTLLDASHEVVGTIVGGKLRYRASQPE